MGSPDGALPETSSRDQWVGHSASHGVQRWPAENPLTGPAVPPPFFYKRFAPDAIELLMAMT